MSKLQEFLKEQNIEISDETCQKLNEMVTSYGEHCAAAAREELVAGHANEVAFLKEQANSYGQSIQEEMIGKLSDYAAYATQEFIAENKEKLVQTEEYLRMKSAFETIQESFERNGFHLNGDVRLEEAAAQVTEAKGEFEKVFGQLTEANAQVAAAEEKLLESTKKIAFLEATTGLAATQIEAVQGLMESFEYKDLEEYGKGIQVAIENVKAKGKSGAVETLNEQAPIVVPQKKVDTKMAGYVGGLKRLATK